MADKTLSNAMDINDRGGKHPFEYEDGQRVEASFGVTPSQTVGPFFAYGLTPGAYGYPLKDIHSSNLTGADRGKTTITLEGQVFDGDGASVHDALVEIIQADETGCYADSPRNDGFSGYGRCGTGSNGPAEHGGDTRFSFVTIKPGSTGNGAAPFLTMIVTMRGLLNHCITRVYFEEDDLSSDPVLAQVPENRLHTLVARNVGTGRYRFDIHMQGENETVFFDL